VASAKVHIALHRVRRYVSHVDEVLRITGELVDNVPKCPNGELKYVVDEKRRFHIGIGEPGSEHEEVAMPALSWRGWTL
jgi:hypothetical protein